MRLGTQPRQRLTLVVACTAQVMMVLDVMIVSVALPSLQRELHLSPAGLEWVVSAYALALAALIPTGGALGDHFGRKRVFMSGVALFMLASVGCALSVSGGMLIGFRVIQGIGGAVMSSLTLSLITEAYPREARTGPIGLWAAVSGLAVAGGSVVGGLLLSVFPWSSIFWVNVPIAVVTLVISRFAVVESREPVPRPFDTAGVALSASGLLLLTFGFVDSSDATWHSPVVAAGVAAGVAVLVVFFVWEHRAAFPMVPPALLRTPSFGRACAVYLLAYLAFSGFIYYVTLFFQNVDGWSALRTGLSWLFFCIPYFAVAQLSKWVERWLPVASAVGWGCLIAAAGVLGMSQLTTATPFAWPAACYILVGVGFALMVPAGSSAAMAEVPEGSSGIGSGLFNACRQIGTATGLAILGSIGAGVTLADWHHQAGSLPRAEQQRAAQIGADVAGRSGPHRRRVRRPARARPGGGLLSPGFRARPAPGRRDPRRRWGRRLPGPAAPPEPCVPAAPKGRCEHEQVNAKAHAVYGILAAVPVVTGATGPERASWRRPGRGGTDEGQVACGPCYR